VCDEVSILYGGKVRSHGNLTDILTVEDKTRLVTPRLESSLVDEVKALLARHGIAEDIRIDHPTMDLEDFFLEVVRKAREASVETAGAQAGGEIAAYLRTGEGEGGEAAGESLLEALRSDREDAAGAAAGDAGDAGTGKAGEPPREAEEAAPKVDTDKLRRLAGEEEQETPSVPEPGEATADDEEKAREANEKLKNLLDGSDAK
jgi:hypothetical protein